MDNGNLWIMGICGEIDFVEKHQGHRSAKIDDEGDRSAGREPKGTVIMRGVITTTTPWYDLIPLWLEFYSLSYTKYLTLTQHTQSDITLYTTKHATIPPKNPGK